jgi:hypothetical protein
MGVRWFLGGSDAVPHPRPPRRRLRLGAVPPPRSGEGLAPAIGVLRTLPVSAPSIDVLASAPGIERADHAKHGGRGCGTKHAPLERYKSVNAVALQKRVSGGECRF